MSMGPSLAEVIGMNARGARKSAKKTLDEVAAAAREYGLRWSESRVADFESGRVAPNLATLTALSLALAKLRCRRATLPDLVESIHNPVQINESLALWSDDLRDVLRGEPLKGKPFKKPQRFAQTQIGAGDAFTTITDPWEERIAHHFRDRYSPPTALMVQGAFGATEDRVRKSLGISSMLLVVLSSALWQRSFSRERDERAGNNANAQKRGQVSRQMQSELKAAIQAAEGGKWPR